MGRFPFQSPASKRALHRLGLYGVAVGGIVRWNRCFKPPARLLRRVREARLTYYAFMLDSDNRYRQTGRVEGWMHLDEAEKFVEGLSSARKPILYQPVAGTLLEAGYCVRCETGGVYSGCGDPHCPMYREPRKCNPDDGGNIA
jgi:hypothetical protein